MTKVGQDKWTRTAVGDGGSRSGRPQVNRSAAVEPS